MFGLANGAIANGDSGGVALLLDARLASVYPLSQMFVDSAAVGEADFVRDKLLGNGKFGVAWCVAAIFQPAPAAHWRARVAFSTVGPSSFPGTVCVLKEVAKAAIIEEAVLPQLRREVRVPLALAAVAVAHGCGCLLLLATPPSSCAPRHAQIEIQSRLDHPSITRCGGYYETPESIVIVLELANSGTLYEELYARGGRVRRAAAARAAAADSSAALLPPPRAPRPRAAPRSSPSPRRRASRSRWRRRSSTCTRTTSSTATSSPKTFSCTGRRRRLARARACL